MIEVAQVELLEAETDLVTKQEVSEVMMAVGVKLVDHLVIEGLMRNSCSVNGVGSNIK